MARCWNCCGLTFNEFETGFVCPNCGHVATTGPADVSIVGDWNPEIEVRGTVEFSTTGPVYLESSDLLTYAVDAEWLKVATEQGNIVAVFARPEDAEAVEVPSHVALILTHTPMVDFFRFHNYLARGGQFYEHGRPTFVSGGARVETGAHVAPMDVFVGKGAAVCSGAVLLANTVVGANSYIGPGTVLGVDGARFITCGDGKKLHVAHVGGVVIGEDVFVGANCVVVKSVWRQCTRIEHGAFINNLVNIGHNCQIKPGAEVLSGAVLCGSVTVERGARISPGAIVSNGLTIGEEAWVTIGAVVTKDVLPGQRVSGNFAVPHGKLIQHVKEIAEIA